jgi:uncharacterized protein YecE (DUF72 family)
MPVVPPGRAHRGLPRVGCSGWNYKSWRGRFYPRDLPPSRWLDYYTHVFDTVEVNGTFYRLPEAPTFRAWREQTPSSFLMAVKASRFLTHMKRLRDPEEPLERLLARAAELGPRLGPVLYQLPPTLHLDLARLEHFLEALPRRVAGSRRALQHVLEFRDVSWYVDETYELLDRHGVAVCLHDKAGSALRDVSTGGCVYVRFHGTSGRYHGSYGDRALDAWAVRLTDEWREGRTVYAYFNNDPDAVATENARRLRALIRNRLGHPPEPARRSS